MNERSRVLRSRLLRRYYKSVALGWFQPRSFHWAKIVTEEGYWKWIRADAGIRGRLLKKPPPHIYQTVLRIKSNKPPRGNESSGFLLGDPLLFDMDIIPKNRPISVWDIVDSVDDILELVDVVEDRGQFKLNYVIFSGSRGVHVVFKPEDLDESTIINLDTERWKLRALRRNRNLIARSIGYWCNGWDWKVTADIWRVSRVPWSIHGRSGLRAIPLKPPYTPDNFLEQMKYASIFSSTRNIRVRIIQPVPVFTFVDNETYGPYTRGWATKLPISVALHLIWQGFAKSREEGPRTSKTWFESSWKTLFRPHTPVHNMGSCPPGGLRHG